MAAPVSPLFLPDGAGGTRFCLYHAPAVAPARGAIVYVHPWAEEMNKSRRMAALTCRALAQQGWAVVQPDLLGCGDSSGDFADARWETWVNDVARVSAWLQRRHPEEQHWLWGLRAGALIAAAAQARLGGTRHLLLWQPVLQGKAALQQFLRLKAAARLADGGGKDLLDAAKTDLAQGRSVEVAGYTLHPDLARGLGQATLTPSPATSGRHLVWLEVAASDAPEAGPAARAALPRWQAAGWQVQQAAVSGPAFWQTTEIEEAPALIQATLAALTSTLAGAPAAAPQAA